MTPRVRKSSWRPQDSSRAGSNPATSRCETWITTGFRCSSPRSAHRRAMTCPAWSCTATSTSCPATPEQFEPRVEGDRLIGRGAYDMKGGLAAMMCALKDVERQERVRVRFVCVPDEESEEIDERSTDAVVKRGLGGDFAITGEPTEHAHRGRGQGRAGDADRGPRPRRAQLDAMAGRQRGAEGDRRVPQHRVAAVRARVLRDVRPAVDQPRPDRGRARSEHGPGQVHDGGRRPLPAGSGSRFDPRAGAWDRGDRGQANVHPPDRVGLAHRSVRAGVAGGGRVARRTAR